MSESHICTNCNKEIESGTEVIEALDNFYHPDCFLCTSCNQKILQLPIEFELGTAKTKDLVCRQCYRKKKNERFSEGKGTRFTCAKCNGNLDEHAKFCTTCGTPTNYQVLGELKSKNAQ